MATTKKSKVVTAIPQIMKKLKKNWDSEGIRRSTIHGLLAYEGICPQKDATFEHALKQLVEDGVIKGRWNKQPKETYYYLVV